MSVKYLMVSLPLASTLEGKGPNMPRRGRETGEGSEREGRGEGRERGGGGR